MTAPELAPGAVIAGRYQVAAVIGHGGSSNTYYARTQDGREVAAKVFDPALAQRTDVMQIVEQVYGMTNAMPADLVARVIDAGYDPTTVAPFSVTERVPLPSLAQIVSQRVLTVEETVVLLKSMARGLDAAHGAKLMHHALKPTNVFLGLGAAPSVRITDFGAGLARLAVPSADGYALAAPWLAPEQVQQGMQAGAAADVFASALVAFFALTGRSYWRSCQGGQVDLASWQRELVGPRDAASTRAGQIGVQIDRAFDPVIGCALGMDPNQRYRSVGELAAALEGVAAARGGGNAQTMAYNPGDYPPPPAPMGAAAAAGAGYPPVQASDPAAMRAPLGGPTLASAGPGRPPAIPPRSASSKVAPIVVILVALVLVGGGAAALVLMGKKKTDDGPIAIPADSAAPATSAATAPPSSASAEAAASAEPAASAEASAAPSAEASAAPSASASAEADAPAGEIEAAVSCDPACDEIVVDDKQVTDKDKAIPLTPGKHKITVRKQGYYSLSETVYAAPGKKIEKVFHLTQSAKASGSANAKPCGKFLKHCN